MLSHTIVFSMAFAPVFIKDAQEIAEKLCIVITEHRIKHIIYESPYLSRAQVIDFLHYSDKKRQTERYDLEFSFCLTK